MKTIKSERDEDMGWRNLEPGEKIYILSWLMWLIIILGNILIIIFDLVDNIKLLMLMR